MYGLIRLSRFGPYPGFSRFPSSPTKDGYKMKVSLLLFVVFCAASCFASTDCQSNFSKGAGPAEITFCVTANGNIVQIKTDMDKNIILSGAEGYAVCGVGTPYFDLGPYGDSGNWQPPITIQPHGPNTFPLTIIRSSVDLAPDGRPLVILNQTFSYSNGGRSVRVLMTKDGASLTGTLIRYADVSGTSEHGAISANSSFIWNDGAFGVMASPTGPNISTRVLFGGLSGVTVSGAVDPCNAVGPVTLPYAGDSAIVNQWTVGRLGKGTRFNAQAIVDYLPIR